jgi:hypothetical protein
MRYMLAIALSVAALGGAYLLNLAARLGAHPWWADQVILIGGSVGLVLAVVVSRWAGLKLAGLAAVLSLLAFRVATTGKERFAVSFAEDAVAGKLWHFGWIATCGLAAFAITTFLLFAVRANSKIA